MRAATSFVMITFAAIAVSATLAQSPASAPAGVPKAAPKAPAGGPKAAPKAPPAPPAIIYAPKRSFSQWVDDLPKDPALLVGFIISLLSGMGFLFVIYTVTYELVMGIPYKCQSSILTGGSPSQGSGGLVK